MKVLLHWCAAAATILPVDAGEPAPKQPLPPPPPFATAKRNHFRISGGYSYRTLGDVRFHTGSESQRYALPFFASVLGNGPAPAGPANAYADRNYIDGYVYRDGGTAALGDTWYWGYDGAGQLQGENLVFHGANGARSANSSNSSYSDPGSWDIDGDGGAPVIQLDWLHDIRPQLAVGISLQWSFLNFDGSNRTTNFSASQRGVTREINATDLYDLQGVVIPDAPYQGGLAGPGPLINNIPTQRLNLSGRVLESNSARLFNIIEESLEVDLHTLSLGPTIEAAVGPVRLSLSTGLALNIANWDADHEETLYVSHRDGPARKLKRWSYHESDTEALAGWYVQGGVSMPLNKALLLTAFGRYDWSEKLTGSVGPSRFSVDPSGWSFGGMIGWQF